MSNLFLTVLGISIIGSVAILSVIFLNNIFRKNYSKQWVYIIWAVIAIRLIIPVNVSLISLPEAFNPKNLINKIQRPDQEVRVYVDGISDVAAEEKSTYIEDTANQNILNITDVTHNVENSNTSEANEQDEIPEAHSITSHMGVSSDILDIISLVWGSGIIIFLLYHVVAYISFKGKVRRWSIAIKDQSVLEQLRNICSDMGIKGQIDIFRCSQIYTPMLIGFIKPCIVLPTNEFNEEQLYFIIKHELIHYKHHDLYYKLILLCATAMHWFNPLVHYMVHLANNDMELYCDETLLSKSNLTYRENYSNMMLYLMSSIIKKNNILLSTGFGNYKKQLKDRFYQIMNSKPTKKGTFFVIALIGLLIAGGSLVAWLVPEKNDLVETENELKEASSAYMNIDELSTDKREKADNILVIGLDGKKKDDNLRADSILLVNINPDTKKITLISFLRDMYLQIPDHKKDKLSNVYSLGGVDLIKNTIETNFKLTIDHTVTVYMDNFEKIIDSIGGVEIELSEKEAEYLNSTNYISKKKNRNVVSGKQLLNGNQTLGYLRVRMIPTLEGEAGDIGRTARLRNLLTCVIKDSSKKGIIELAKTISNIISCVSTDMSLPHMLMYLNTLLPGDINTDTFIIPVENSYSETKQDHMSVLEVDLDMNVKVLHQLGN